MFAGRAMGRGKAHRTMPIGTAISIGLIALQSSSVNPPMKR